MPNQDGHCLNLNCFGPHLQLDSLVTSGSSEKGARPFVAPLWCSNPELGHALPLCIIWLSRDSALQKRRGTFSACLLLAFLESDHEILMKFRWTQPDLQEAKESRMVAEAMNIAKTAYVGISSAFRGHWQVMHLLTAEYWAH